MPLHGVNENENENERDRERENETDSSEHMKAPPGINAADRTSIKYTNLARHRGLVASKFHLLRQESHA